jgi:phthalate 4,5-dioxygenase reductase subunit
MVGSPENEFELVAAPKYLLIAGGIGITPILAMARHLKTEGTPFKLVYCTRRPEETAYLTEVSDLQNAYIHHDNGDFNEFYDFWDHFEEPGAEHVYCCGPAPMMEEIKAVSGHWPEGRVHFEDFNGVEKFSCLRTVLFWRLCETLVKTSLAHVKVARVVLANAA